jgi:hypothetical protein
MSLILIYSCCFVCPALTADTWWKVVPGRKEDVTILMERCQRLLGWDNEFATLVCAAFREFMECKAFVRDWEAAKLSPSLPVDRMWHQHILDIKRYADDCKLLFGQVIHHNPDGDIDVPARNIRIESTKALMSTRHGPEGFWHSCCSSSDGKWSSRCGSALAYSSQNSTSVIAGFREKRP